MIPQNKHQWLGFALWVLGHSLVEFWLGRTQKTQASSVIDFVLMSAACVLSLFKGKKNGNKPTGTN